MIEIRRFVKAVEDFKATGKLGKEFKIVEFVGNMMMGYDCVTNTYIVWTDCGYAFELKDSTGKAIAVMDDEEDRPCLRYMYDSEEREDLYVNCM